MIISLIISAVMLILFFSALVGKGYRRRMPYLFAYTLAFAAMAVAGEVMLTSGSELIPLFNLGAPVIGIIFSAVTVRALHRESMLVAPLYAAFFVPPVFIIYGIGWLMQQEGELADMGDISLNYYWVQLVITQIIGIGAVYYDLLPDEVTDGPENIISGMVGHEYE